MDSFYNQTTIEAYLQGKLSSSDRRDFESALRRDATLQKMVLPEYLALKAERLYEQASLRDLVQEVSRETGPLPDPELTFGDRLSLWIRNPRFVALASIPLILSVLYLFSLPPFGKNATAPDQIDRALNAAFIEPVNMAQAGAVEDSIEAERILRQASDFYWSTPGGAAADSLNRLAQGCQGYCMASYYMAHWYLKNGDYPAAERYFVQTEQQSAYLRQFPRIKDLSKIRFNLLLSRIRQAPDDPTAVQALDNLMNASDCSDLVKEKAEALKKVLKNR
jgi:hypothetical protein